MIAVSESEPNYPCHSPYIKHQLINKHMKDPEMFKMSETYEKSRPPAQRNCSDMTSETLKRSSGLKSAEAGRGKRKQLAFTTVATDFMFSLQVIPRNYFSFISGGS